MATNYKNDIYLPITGKQTLPASANGTGTIETVGSTVTGTGTLFKTEMPKGSWLVDLTQDEIRIVESVESDTRAYLVKGQAFTTDIPALTTPNIIHKKNTDIVAISVKPIGADCEVDGEVLPAGEVLTFSKDSRDNSAHRDLVDPIIVDGTGSNVLTLIMR